MSFRGSAIPVVDLSTIALGTATPSRMMTRIVVVHYEPASSDGVGLLGLLVPEVMQTAHFDSSRFTPAGIRNDRAPYLGPVLTTEDGVLQQVLVAALLSEELRDSLFHGEIAA
jgi:chemotaxis-related protein WspB